MSGEFTYDGIDYQANFSEAKSLDDIDKDYHDTLEPRCLTCGKNIDPQRPARFIVVTTLMPEETMYFGQCAECLPRFTAAEQLVPFVIEVFDADIATTEAKGPQDDKPR